eukprot:TRINITY_DN58916_c0_g1_i1.p1 TRINITY_DN58916_c0_g1~~TRINITY_DN58916_c0_g1_i1.p1  ORF type:complete len:471 (+),score=65.53 TRINITY_DN58916_c0_g1_i1:81-1493(+)
MSSSSSPGELTGDSSAWDSFRTSVLAPFPALAAVLQHNDLPSCLPRRLTVTAPRRIEAPRISTTVSISRSSDAASSRSIRTTVRQSRCQEQADSILATLKEEPVPFLSDSEAQAARQLLAERASLTTRSCSSEIRYLVEGLATTALQLPLAWSMPAAAGVAMAVGPPPAPPRPPAAQNPYAPFAQQAQRMAAMRQQQEQMLQEEEEEFMALIFPGFRSDAFIWQITVWQMAEFGLSMLFGRRGPVPSPCTLYSLGASWGPAIARGQVWRLVTPVMLHASMTHLLFNVFFQLRMGFGMEKQFGRNKMMMIYFGCGLIGNLISVLADPHKLAVGASTAGFGLIGVWFAEILLSWNTLGPAKERTIIWIALMLVSVTTMSSMTPNMDLYGHLGGALGGFLLGIIVSDMPEDRQPEFYAQLRAGAVVLLGLLLSGGLTKAVLLSPIDPVPTCPELSGFGHLSGYISDALSAHTS